MSTAPQSVAGIRKQPMSREQRNHVFEDRYPALSDLLAHGGIPGLRYALVHAASVGRYQSIGWDLVARLSVITIRITSGAKAGDHPAMLMCNGRPITGASPYSSTRPYGADPLLDESTGLAPSNPVETRTVAPKATPAPKERTAS
jgi:hypothetical protein